MMFYYIQFYFIHFCSIMFSFSILLVFSLFCSIVMPWYIIFCWLNPILQLAYVLAYSLLFNSNQFFFFSFILLTFYSVTCCSGLFSSIWFYSFMFSQVFLFCLIFYLYCSIFMSWSILLYSRIIHFCSIDSVLTVVYWPLHFCSILFCYVLLTFICIFFCHVQLFYSFYAFMFMLCSIMFFKSILFILILLYSGVLFWSNIFYPLYWSDLYLHYCGWITFFKQ